MCRVTKEPGMQRRPYAEGEFSWADVPKNVPGYEEPRQKEERQVCQMTKLDCNVVSCSYNEDNCCRRADIQVEGTDARTPSETSCGSFEPRGCGCAKNETGVPAKATAVACEAVECRFNREKKCSADHIGIAGGHADSFRETECGSFSHNE